MSQTGSYHSPKILYCDLKATPFRKSFKFLMFWIKPESFLDVVKENWQANFSGNPFILFNYTLKKLKKALSIWSKSTYRNIFQKIASLEELVIVHITQFVLNPTNNTIERDY